MDNQKLIQKIIKLKKEKNALVLVHNYQRPEIYEIADFIGDSLGLARIAARTDKKTIVFCGVHFMAETAKILSPKKTVLLPALNAGCPMADMITGEDVKNLRKQYPKAAVACYVNTTAEVKANSDICVTSSNAVSVINSLKENQVIFVPDENLSNFVAKHTDKELIPFKGYCHVHQRFSYQELKCAKERFSNAKVIVHPECTYDVIDLADHVCSTSQMIDYAKNSKSQEFLIGTEVGMIERLRKEIPNKKFYSAGSVKLCPNMKKNNLELVYEALKYNKNQIEVPEDIAKKARLAVKRMLDVK